MKIYNSEKKNTQFSRAAEVKTWINCDFLYRPRKQFTMFGVHVPAAYKKNPSKLEDYTTDRLTTAVPQLRRFVASFPPRRPGFEPRSGHAVDKVALGRFSTE
jgi:hypothetical protein